MTYRSKRAREILAATAKSHDPLLAQSPITTTARESSATEVVSQPTKKQAIKSLQTEILKDDKWGPFSPPITTTKSDQQPPNSLGSIWNNPPGSTSSSVKEATTSNAKGNTTLVSGIILPIDVWSNNGVQYYVEFNDLCQPIRKGGHILVKFISMIAKMESHCPVEEKDWHAIDKHFKGKIIKDIRDDVKAKVEELRMMHPKMFEQELEDEAFQQTMYGNEIPDRPVGYGLGVKEGEIFGVRGAVRQGNASPDLLNKASEFLGKASIRACVCVCNNNNLPKVLYSRILPFILLVFAAACCPAPCLSFG
uniref:Uncharacterized protein n=1 Tax=Chenopodium quinoa TaxID=63459 RepID=A0A803N803_CHEQI